MITGNPSPESHPASLPKKSRGKFAVRLGALGALLLAGFFLFAAIRASQFAKLKGASPLTSEQSLFLQKELRARYPASYQLLKPLPYKLGSRSLDLLAESAILIDASNGCILYQKNADEVIPPASMTKLFCMYLVEEEVAAGKLSYNQLIPLPPQSWACNMPPHSSLMFLGEGQRVTLEELLLGLSICSGNDAAYALAYTICGNMEAFVDRMNALALDLGLSHTYFEESSGYSERNSTTAAEMAAFSRLYLLNHPDSLGRYHSVRDFTYPKERNLAPGDSPAAQDFSKGLPSRITMPIHQKNTNPLLGLLPGCDGLKTGYIDESGYNLALTAERDGTRLVSITMRGPGASVQEGQQGRIHDGRLLMEWAFANFFDYEIPDECRSVFTKIYGYKEKSVSLVPAWQDAITVPFVAGSTLEECRSLVSAKIFLADRKAYPAAIRAGDELGEILLLVDGAELCKIPLVSDRTAEKAGLLVRAADFFIRR